MYTASSILAKARKYYIPSKKISRKNKIHIIGNKKNRYRYYYGDQNYYREKYLKSEHWKLLRIKKLQLNPRCEKCGSNKKIEPHHINYKNLYNVDIEDLMTLCRRCHIKIHLCART